MYLEDTMRELWINVCHEGTFRNLICFLVVIMAKGLSCHKGAQCPTMHRLSMFNGNMVLTEKYCNGIVAFIEKGKTSMKAR
jgi:hypothetical protein